MKSKGDSMKNWVILITGASMGIGRELALLFAKQGAIPVLVARSKERLEDLAEEIKNQGGRAFVVVADITQSKNINHLLAVVEKEFGRVDVLINNAGKGVYSEIEKAPVSEVRELFDLNFFSVVELTQKALPLLRQSANPSIINISSIAGHLAIPKMGFYCASKFALNAFGRTLRMELAGEKIHVLNVYPGTVATDFSKNATRIGKRPDILNTQGKGLSAAKLAQIILKALQKRKKEEYVIFQNRLWINIQFFFPSLMEYFMAKLVR